MHKAQLSEIIIHLARGDIKSANACISLSPPFFFILFIYLFILFYLFIHYDSPRLRGHQVCQRLH